jgi:hypothetical protein
MHTKLYKKITFPVIFYGYMLRFNRKETTKEI